MRKKTGSVLHKTTLRSLYRKVNETERVIIKKSHIQNYDILVTSYTKVSISAITKFLTKDLKIANIATVLGEATL